MTPTKEEKTSTGIELRISIWKSSALTTEPHLPDKRQSSHSPSYTVYGRLALPEGHGSVVSAHTLILGLIPVEVSVSVFLAPPLFGLIPVEDSVSVFLALSLFGLSHFFISITRPTKNIYNH